MEQRCNGIMEDLGAVMGFEATNRLIAIFGGASLYVPRKIEEGHPIVRVVGVKPALRLVEAFGGEVLNLPWNVEFGRLRRVRRVATLLGAGVSVTDTAMAVGITPRHVANDRALAQDLGLLPDAAD